MPKKANKFGPGGGKKAKSRHFTRRKKNKWKQLLKRQEIEDTKITATVKVEEIEENDEK